MPYFVEDLRFLNKSVNTEERSNFDGWWQEQIGIYGQQIVFYSNQTSISGSNPLYGEQPMAGFLSGQNLIVLLNLNNDSYLLSKFGIIADSDINGVIHPLMFNQALSTVTGILSAEPKAGDVIWLQEYGSDRLNFPKRQGVIFELTEVIDEFVNNPLGGHYVWFFKGKRSDYSNEPGSPGPGVGNTPLNDNDILSALAQSNFDYNDVPCVNTSVYGDYGNTPPTPTEPSDAYIESDGDLFLTPNGLDYYAQP